MRLIVALALVLVAVTVFVLMGEPRSRFLQGSVACDSALAAAPGYVAFDDPPVLIEVEHARDVLRSNDPGEQTTVDPMYWIFVDVSGRVQEAVVHRSSGSAVVDSAGARAVREFHFRPARMDGLSVCAWLGFPVAFEN